ncbi:hypothetical protein ArV2_gp41 [Arthrobacter phage vB_ArS-ArV2]|uniref:Uncharacterized protein n=1 Tax=Arthrobacter phage vB_ArS-ArV2 TaxID=1414742 RepID=V5R9B7_9CAUD|nr:hypothetical protein ArV2_gp41 [Arthrobacter phage vB_ArS-ArV2]AHB31652.1 hypothetical protein ArV2_gp41 [Arthrobacter phage vB_ArS-ArV2]
MPGMRRQVSQDRYLEEPDPVDYEALEDEQDTRASDDADAKRKGEQ